jgi:hypothetical protein
MHGALARRDVFAILAIASIIAANAPCFRFPLAYFVLCWVFERNDE